MPEAPEFIQSPEAARKVALPSRAFMLSWRDQTLPARRSALSDSESHFGVIKESEDWAQRDLALGALIADALQPIEDIAHLGSAWDKPFGGLAYYIRATAYSRRTATNFWGSVAKWDDDRIKVFAGLYGRDPRTRELLSMIPPEIESQLSEEHRSVIKEAEQTTVHRLRILLGSLGHEWQQFSRYYNAYKHGGLLVNRDDVCWVDDDVEEVTEETMTHDPSIATWDLRDEEGAGRGDFALASSEVADTVARSGWLALDLLERFIESRGAIFEAVDFRSDGSVERLKEMTFPWTVWLREADLTPTQWKLIGRGPRISWISGTGTEHPSVESESE
jgi:hypothetical protein